MKRALVTASAAALLALLPPLESAAQVRLVPRAGLYAPVTEVGRVVTDEGVRELGRRRPSFAVGGAVEIGPTDRTSFRLDGLYGTSGEIPVTGNGCGAAACRGRSTVLILTVSAVVRPVAAGAFVQPYLVLGGGLERPEYSFGDRVIGEGLEDGPAPAGQLGAGVEWTLGILRGVLELSDFVGGAVVGPDGEGGVQHDLFVTLGLTLG